MFVYLKVNRRFVAKQKSKQDTDILQHLYKKVTDREIACWYRYFL